MYLDASEMDRLFATLAGMDHPALLVGYEPWVHDPAHPTLARDLDYAHDFREYARRHGVSLTEWSDQSNGFAIFRIQTGRWQVI
jgi:hypothetical protein